MATDAIAISSRVCIANQVPFEPRLSSSGSATAGACISAGTIAVACGLHASTGRSGSGSDYLGRHTVSCGEQCRYRTRRADDLSFSIQYRSADAEWSGGLVLILAIGAGGGSHRLGLTFIGLFLHAARKCTRRAATIQCSEALQDS